jgi:prevent-host-death family protein
VRVPAPSGTAAVLPGLRAPHGRAGDPHRLDGAVQPARRADRRLTDALRRSHFVAPFCCVCDIPETIAQRQLRNDSAEIMRRVEAGESFIITRNGKPVADLVPHSDNPRRRRYTGRELQEMARKLPPIDVEQWRRSREADDLIFGDDRIEY